MELELKQYEIIIVNLDPTIGSEIKKIRHCVILSPNEMNKYLRTVIIAPITSKSKIYPTRVKIKIGQKNGWIVLDQIRTIDRRRVYRKKSELKPKEVEMVKSIIKETLVD